jgi:hypothetical protein
VWALSRLARLPIIHVHGQLGPIHKCLTSQTEVTTKATDVVFLGFGYDKRSLRRLGVLDNSPRHAIYRTSFGMSEEQKSELTSTFEKRITLARGNRRIVHYLTDFHRMKLKDRAKGNRLLQRALDPETTEREFS